MSSISIMGYGNCAICPKCKGLMMLGADFVYQCVDCNTKYQIDGSGTADREVTVTVEQHR